MKQLILDGYNLIHEIPLLKKSLSVSLEAGRVALADFIQVWKNNRAYGGRIKIIFDGTDGFDSNSEIISGINCIYTQSGQNADDYIISMVKETKNRTGITVISNDTYVRGTCSSLGAATEQPTFLTAHPKTKTRKITGQKNTRGMNKVSIAAEKEINKFLIEEWKIE